LESHPQSEEERGKFTFAYQKRGEALWRMLLSGTTEFGPGSMRDLSEKDFPDEYK